MRTAPSPVRSVVLVLAVLGAGVVGAGAGGAAPGEVEPGFGGPGFVLTDVGRLEGASDLLVQPDGRVIAVGGTEEAALLVRYRTDGSLDSSFGANGIVHAVPPEPAHPSDGVLQPDGKIVVAGSDGGLDDFLVVRYLANGRLDSGFGAGGVVKTDFGNVDQAFAVALQPDGKLIAAGRSGPQLALARYLPNGALDTGFGSGGKVTTPAAAAGGGAEAGAVAVLPGGAVMVGGVDVGPGGAQRMVLARYTPAGALDAGFGAGGRVAPAAGRLSDVTALLVQSGDRVVVGGSVDLGSERLAHGLARYNPDGSLDTTFGDGGSTTTNLGIRGRTNDLAVDASGRIVAAGGAAYSTDSPGVFSFVAVLRFSADGAPDRSFGCGGHTLVELSVAAGGRGMGVGVVPDGAIVTAGVAFTDASDGQADVLLVRMRSGGPEDAAYWIARSDGGVSSFGAAGACGSMRGLALNRPIVGHAGTPSGDGYWLVASDGGVFAFGDARFLGSTGAIRLNQPVVGMAATPSGNGYWLVAADGGVFAFGDARFLGSTGAIRLNRPVVGMANARSINGYWLVAADGGVFAFGDARFLGSTGAIRLNRPVVGMASTHSDQGYWLVAADGGVFAFGDAPFRGSAGGIPLIRLVVGMASTPSSNGYWLGAGDGGVFAFGDAPFRGSAATARFPAPAVTITGRQ